eukprot:gene18494-biopygen15584
MSSISMKVEDIEKERKKEKSVQYDLNMMNELQDEQRAFDQRLSPQETRLLTLEETGAENGRLIWKIGNLTEERRKAIRYGNSLFSPTFLTDKFGYKMGMRLYLNGDGIGHGNSVSLYIVVYKGEFDDILEWLC